MSHRWSVCFPVVVLERSRGLRALRRSHELVRGNGWRVLALILMLALPLSLAAAAFANASLLLGSAPALACELLLVTLTAPIPVIAVTALYYELRQGHRSARSAPGQRAPEWATRPRGRGAA